MEDLLYLNTCSVCNQTNEDCKQDHEESETEYMKEKGAGDMVKTINECDLLDLVNIKKECDLLESYIKEAESLKNDTYCYLEEYFGKIKNEADASKEQYMQKIADKHQEIINKLNRIEQECKQKANEKVMQLEENLAKTKQNLKEWRESLNTVYYASDEDLKGLVHEVKNEKEVIKNLLEKTHKDLLLNKQYKLQPCAILISNYFGDIIFH